LICEGAWSQGELANTTSHRHDGGNAGGGGSGGFECAPDAGDADCLSSSGAAHQSPRSMRNAGAASSSRTTDHKTRHSHDDVYNVDVQEDVQEDVYTDNYHERASFNASMHAAVEALVNRPDTMHALNSTQVSRAAINQVDFYGWMASLGKKIAEVIVQEEASDDVQDMQRMPKDRRM
jgi:hypothetical protein